MKVGDRVQVQEASTGVIKEISGDHASVSWDILMHGELRPGNGYDDKTFGNVESVLLDNCKIVDPSDFGLQYTHDGCGVPVGIPVATKPGPGGTRLIWSERNQELLEYFIFLTQGHRSVGLASFTTSTTAKMVSALKHGAEGGSISDARRLKDDNAKFLDGQEGQDLLRFMFNKPDLVIKRWSWSDRDDTPTEIS